MENKRVNEVKSITKKRNQLTIEFFDSKGKIRQKNTGLSPTKANRKKLKRLIPKIEQELREKHQKQEQKTFGEYAEIYLELKKHHSKYSQMAGHIRKFNAYFGANTLPAKIKLTDVKRFFVQLTKKDGTPLKRATKIQWYHTLSNILQLAWEDGEIEYNIVAQWKLPKQDDAPPQKRPFTPEEIDRLLENSTGTLHNYIGIGIWTGLRPEEIVALIISDIDFHKQIITVKRAFSKHKQNSNTKTRQGSGKVPIFDAVIPFLKHQIAYARSKNSLYLFCREDGSHVKSSDEILGHAEYINSDGKLEHNGGSWHRLRMKIGLPNAQAHWTRHTFAVQALKSKQFTPQEIAGMMRISLKTLYGNYARFIGDDHVDVDRSIDLFSA